MYLDNDKISALCQVSMGEGIYKRFFSAVKHLSMIPSYYLISKSTSTEPASHKCEPVVHLCDFY